MKFVHPIAQLKALNKITCFTPPEIKRVRRQNLLNAFIAERSMFYFQ